jgi:acylphosphatase
VNGLARQRVRVYGEVQGVFFRDSCRQEASRLGVAGWARNANDGSVEAVFEGDVEAVEAMCRWCQVGPSRARVERVETVIEEPKGERGFRVTG